MAKAEGGSETGAKDRPALKNVMDIYKSLLRSRGKDHAKDMVLYKVLLKVCMNRKWGWKQALDLERAVPCRPFCSNLFLEGRKEERRSGTLPSHAALSQLLLLDLPGASAQDRGSYYEYIRREN